MATKSGSFSKGIVWIIILLLIVGLGGFGISNFGGSVQSIGAVGEREISTEDYYRAVQGEVRAMSAEVGQPLTLEQANQFAQFAYGAPLTDRVLTQLITTAALDGETDRIGLSIGDEQVREQVLALPTFQGLDGKFDRETYGEALLRNGLNEREYEDGIRDDTARTLLQAAILGGLNAPAAMSDPILNYVGQRRSFEFVRLDGGDLDAPLPEPSEADLNTYYTENEAAFTAPEQKRITYAWITPDMLIDEVEIDEDALRGLYEERSEEYNSPERRLVERLVFASPEEAAAAVERLTAGEIDFESLVTERGLSLADIDMGDVGQSDLNAEAGEAVFALEGAGITGVVNSDLGPALFRVNAVLDAQVTSFEDAREELLQEFASDRARRVIDAMVGDVEDLLAGGATLEELAEETDLELGQIDWSAGLDEGIASYAGFRDQANAITADDFPRSAIAG